MDKILEITLSSGSTYWISADEYENIWHMLSNPEVKKDQVAVTFYNVSGMEVSTLLSNIIELCSSTKTQREHSRNMNKQYSKQELEAKKEWED